MSSREQSGNWSQLRQELRKRAERDQQAREKYLMTQLTADGVEVMQIDAANTARMEEVVHEFGWPDETMVGPEGAEAAWLLIQHADKNRALQEHCLLLVYEAVQRGTAKKKHYAYLWDRIAVHKQQPQRFGTQFDGELRPRPIEDEDNVNQRRESMGLGTMEDAIVAIRKRHYRT